MGDRVDPGGGLTVVNTVYQIMWNREQNFAHLLERVATTAHLTLPEIHMFISNASPTNLKSTDCGLKNQSTVRIGVPADAGMIGDPTLARTNQGAASSSSSGGIVDAHVLKYVATVQRDHVAYKDVSVKHLSTQIMPRMQMPPEGLKPAPIGQSGCLGDLSSIKTGFLNGVVSSGGKESPDSSAPAAEGEDTSSDAHGKYVTVIPGHDIPLDPTSIARTRKAVEKMVDDDKAVEQQDAGQPGPSMQDFEKHHYSILEGTSGATIKVHDKLYTYYTNPTAFKTAAENMDKWNAINDPSSWNLPPEDAEKWGKASKRVGAGDEKSDDDSYALTRSKVEDLRYAMQTPEMLKKGLAAYVDRDGKRHVVSKDLDEGCYNAVVKELAKPTQPLPEDPPVNPNPTAERDPDFPDIPMDTDSIAQTNHIIEKHQHDERNDFKLNVEGNGPTVKDFGGKEFHYVEGTNNAVLQVGDQVYSFYNNKGGYAQAVKAAKVWSHINTPDEWGMSDAEKSTWGAAKNRVKDNEQGKNDETYALNRHHDVVWIESVIQTESMKADGLAAYVDRDGRRYVVSKDLDEDNYNKVINQLGTAG